MMWPKLYQTIANQGGKIELSTIKAFADRQGNIIYEHNTVPDQVVPREAAYQTLYAMQQTVERGTARSLQMITRIFVLRVKQAPPMMPVIRGLWVLMVKMLAPLVRSWW